MILAGCLGADERERILISLLKREAISTTGLGDQIAVPHAKLESLPDFVGACAISKQGVDFRAADGKKVKTIFLLLSPDDDPYGHLGLLGTIATLVRQEGFLDSLAKCSGTEEAIEFIETAEMALYRD